MKQLYLRVYGAPCAGYCSNCLLTECAPKKNEVTSSGNFVRSCDPNRPRNCDALKFNASLPEDCADLEKMLSELQNMCKDCSEKCEKKLFSIRAVLHLGGFCDDYPIPSSARILMACNNNNYNWAVLGPADGNYNPGDLARLVYETRGITL